MDKCSVSCKNVPYFSIIIIIITNILSEILTKILIIPVSNDDGAQSILATNSLELSSGEIGCRESMIKN